MKRGMKSGLALNLDSSVIQDNLPVPITPGLFMGSIHCSFNEAGMASNGVTHIINTSGTPATFPSSFHYLSISIRDKDYSNLLSCIPACNIFIEAGLEGGGSVLVHCTGGRSRSAAILTAYLMSSQGLGFDAAFATVKQARSLAACNAGFEEQLRAYGECGHDVHRAQQILLRRHLQQAPELRHHSSGAAAGDKGGGPGPVRRLAATTISNPLRIKLLRPQEGTPDVTIPPLRGSDMQYVCRKCQTPLFVASSVVLHTSEDNMRASGRRRGESEVKDGGNNFDNTDKDGGAPSAALRTNSDMVIAAAAALNSEERSPADTGSTTTDTVLVTSPLTSNAANGSVYAFSAQPLQSVLPTDANADAAVSSTSSLSLASSAAGSVAAPPPMTRRHGGCNGAAGKNFDFGMDGAVPAVSSKSARDSKDDATGVGNLTRMSIDPVSLSEIPGKTAVEGMKDGAATAAAVDGALLLRSDLVVPRTPPQTFRPEETRSWIDRMKELECGVTRKEGARHLPFIVAARDEEIAQKIYSGKCECLSWIVCVWGVCGREREREERKRLSGVDRESDYAALS
jgi:hypothetical protein